MEEINKIIELLKRNITTTYVNDILFSWNNEEMAFGSPTQLETQQAINVYETRRLVQKEVTKHDTVFGYEEVLLNLKNNIQRETSLIGAYCTSGGYLIFYKSDELLGILKTTNSNLAKQRELHESYMLKGLSSQIYIFLKGKLMYPLPNEGGRN